MTHLVTDACVKCKYTDCVEVCPVECFHEGEFMVMINPDECIDCGACVPLCPVEAIKSETPELSSWLNLAKEKTAKWPRITVSKNPLPDAEVYKHEKGKFEKYCK